MFGVRACKLCDDGVVVLGEYGLSNVLLSHGYNIATLMARYAPVHADTPSPSKTFVKSVGSCIAALPWLQHMTFAWRAPPGRARLQPEHTAQSGLEEGSKSRIQADFPACSFR